MPDPSNSPVLLAAFANDKSDAANYLRNLSNEARRLRTVWDPAQSLCPLVLLTDATLDDILNAFQKYRDRIVAFHYAGHANGFELLLETAAAGVHRVGAKGLATFLGQQQGLELVFLNGCSTERQAEDLLNAGVGCVISTTQSIDDAIATEFSSRFYGGIVTGAPLHAAYSEAVGSVQALSGGSLDRLIRPKQDTLASHEASRWPWLMKIRPGAERISEWSLPKAVGNPLFGLPDVVQRDLPESPYRHLYRFESEHAEVFFGRGREIRELYQKVSARDAAPVVLFYGPSGVGKSSLLDAGLVPRLSSQCEVRYLRRDPNRGLSETLRQAFLKDVRHLSRRDSWIASEQKLGRPLVIVLDQVEEVFTKPHGELAEELAQCALLLRRIFYSPDRRPQGKLILSFRKEWFAEIDQALADAEVPRSRIFLDRLCREGTIEAITGPVVSPRLAAHYNLRIEPGLSDVIADDLLADPDTPVAPTLQILLTRMWAEALRRNRQHPTFDSTLYKTLHRGGILLADFLRLQTAEIRSQLPQAVESGFLLDLLAFHTTPVGTAAERSLSSLNVNYVEQLKSGLLTQTLKLCEEKFLLTFSRGDEVDSDRCSRLLHDTLAPLIRAEQDDSDLPGQRARRILDNRLVDWLDGHVGVPLDVSDLREVESAALGTRAWSTDELRLIHASRQERSSRRLWGRILKGLGLAALALIAIFGGIAAWTNQKLTQTNGKLSLTIRQLNEVNLQLKDKTKEAEQAKNEAEASKQTAETESRDAKLARDEALSAQTLAESERSNALVARRETRSMLAYNRMVSAAAARDNERNFLRSAHLFAAAAEACDDSERPAGQLSAIPPQSTIWSFAANHTIGEIQLIDSLSHNNYPVHEAWLLPTGEIAVWFGPLPQGTRHQTSSNLVLWTEEGIKPGFALDLEGAPVVVLSQDASQFLIRSAASELQAVDAATWKQVAPPAGMTVDDLPLPVFYKTDVSGELNNRQLAYLETHYARQAGSPIFGLDFTDDGSRLLVWTAKYVPLPDRAVDVFHNTPGVVQVWDLQARAPVTPPLSMETSLRGAKFVNHHQQVLMWGENGRVLLWDISRCNRISKVVTSQQSPPISLLTPASEDNTRQVRIPGSLTTLCWDQSGWWTTSPHLAAQRPHRYMPGIAEMIPMETLKAFRTLGWGGADGRPGMGTGGFAALWNIESGELIYPLFRHSQVVCHAQAARNDELLLTTTRTVYGTNQPMSAVHLWHMPSGQQLIPPIPILNHTGTFAEVDSVGRRLTIRTQTGDDRTQRDFAYVSYEYDLSPDPMISTDDPRLDIVRRTGTLLDQYGNVEYLSRTGLKSLRATSTRDLPYDAWLQDYRSWPDVEPVLIPDQQGQPGVFRKLEQRRIPETPDSEFPDSPRDPP